MMPYMPYLTLWDKISQNLAHLEGSSHKKYKSHRIFSSFCNRFYEEININHTLLWFWKASYMEKKKKKKKKKDFRLYGGSSKVIYKKISQNFVKSPLKFCSISQINVHSLWYVCDASVLCRFFLLSFYVLSDTGTPACKSGVQLS